MTGGQGEGRTKGGGIGSLWERLKIKPRRGEKVSGKKVTAGNSATCEGRGKRNFGKIGQRF